MKSRISDAFSSAWHIWPAVGFVDTEIRHRYRWPAAHGQPRNRRPLDSAHHIVAVIRKRWLWLKHVFVDDARECACLPGAAKQPLGTISNPQRNLHIGEI